MIIKMTNFATEIPKKHHPIILLKTPRTNHPKFIILSNTTPSLQKQRKSNHHTKSRRTTTFPRNKRTIDDFPLFDAGCKPASFEVRAIQRCSSPRDPCYNIPIHVSRSATKEPILLRGDLRLADPATRSLFFS